MIHIESNLQDEKRDRQYTLCGAELNQFAVFLDFDGTWFLGLEPTCETCILLHWTDPSNTFRLFSSVHCVI